jgi:ABC-type uncharacterized transport system auxiliary subunit
MQKWMIGLIAALAAALTGCSSTCDNMAEVADAYIEKVKPCLDANDQQPTAFNVNQCDRAFESCTESEREAVAEYVDCVDKLAECTPGTKDAFKNAREACDDYLESKAGETCLQIFD